MTLQEPEWVVDHEPWWSGAMGTDLSKHVRPFGVDTEGHVYVLCSSHAWATQMRLLAPQMTRRLNLMQYPGVPHIPGIRVRALAVPAEVIEHWATLVGPDLAEETRPQSLSGWGRYLEAEADSAQSRALLSQRGPDVITRVRALVPETTIKWLGRTRLRWVSVAVVTSPDFHDQGLLAHALLDVWHDTTQVFGPEHTLAFHHGNRTPADQMVDDWTAAAVKNTEPLTVTSFGRSPGEPSDGYDQCLVLAAAEDEDFLFADSARDCGIPVVRHVQAP
ncbi:DUF721 domain-containing protein [Streptomyces sp. N35]|uniref:DUF721 domain-containing protein n=1 Tax=Streptomyces sp. N35 TaxID=2795730 RepID=UPI0018F56327|nr:DUF721 domain-containing protein [Streptomyces sp. N35]